MDGAVLGLDVIHLGVEDVELGIAIGDVTG